MFKKLLLNNGAKNGSGISIEFKGLHKIEYREGDKMLIAF